MEKVLNRELIRWIVMCPGPSLELAEYIQYPQDMLVAVNGAILQTRYKFGYWALRDPEVFRTCEQKSDLSLIAPLTKIWTHWNFNNGANEKIAGWVDSTRRLFDSFCWIPFDDLSQLVDFGPNKLWRHMTFFSALALAVINGARKITVYGADMRNEGYFLSGLENSRTDHGPRRWLEERELFNQIIEACCGYGITIERL